MTNEFEIECEFSEPVHWDPEEEAFCPSCASSPPFEDWNFSKMTCSGSGSETSTQELTYELIENAQTGSDFYLSKSLSYGDIFIVFFLMCFVVFGIFNFLTNFIIPKFMNFRK